MKKKTAIAFVILLLAILSLVSVYSTDVNSTDDINKTSLNVSSEGPKDLGAIIQDIKTLDCYKGYDNDTLKWMESLSSRYVFLSNGSFVVMSKEDASQLESIYVTDAYIDEFIDCKIIENRSLGDVKYPRDILLVEDVKYMGQEIHYLQA
ncbi:hypothetical protein [Methanobrevibacter sp.]|uniref:hypothetical protein n=1 Tax=Methanobrevibacter sp. TaxID=66852 RepID=UPI0026E0C1B6|nr:hypothetical protein [Methanobrevibacter sp.]MDO5859479.1 hypothetical protein [Methanobrevibacter sp.]